VNGYAKAVRQILSDNGCWFVRHGKGDHDIWESPMSHKRFPVDNVILSRHTANGILKQAGIPKAF
jgi:predicted RNA binding protein YcfA (HicA-like mRNA interferase family)